jgi:hypothetical protein
VSKAEEEIDDYLSVESTPKARHEIPSAEIPKREDTALTQKLEMFKRIKQRFH